MSEQTVFTVLAVSLYLADGALVASRTLKTNPLKQSKFMLSPCFCPFAHVSPVQEA